MFYGKKTTPPNVKTETIKIPLFSGPDNRAVDSGMPLSTARTVYNYKISKGALETGIGLKKAFMMDNAGAPFELPVLTGEIEQLFVYKRFDGAAGKLDDRLVLRDSNGYFYETGLYQSGTYNRVSVPRTFENVDAVSYRYNGNDVLILSVPSGLFVYNGTDNPALVGAAPPVKTICSHGGRLYASLRGDNTAVWFSETFNPVNWNVSSSDAGYIDFADDGGYVRNVLQFDESVYIFRDFSIERLIMPDDGKEPSLSKVCALGAKIISDTILQCGDIIAFMLRDGLYTFDGKTLKNVFANVTDIIDKESGLRACFNRSKYYLAAKADFCGVQSAPDGNADAGAELKNALFEFGLKDGTVNILRGAYVNDLCAVKTVTAEKVFAALKPVSDESYGGTVFETDYEARILNVALPMFWESAYNAHGAPGKRKLLRKISFLTGFDTRLTVQADGEASVYDVKGSRQPVSVTLNKRCVMFSIAFSGTGGAEIKDAVLELDYI